MPQPTVIMITVTFVENEPLSVDQPEIEITTGDVVIWEFLNLPTHSTPYIHFQNGGQTGPFNFLASSIGGVSGFGNTGVIDTFTYIAEVIGDQSSLATSTGTLSIENTSTQRDTSPDAFLTFEADPPPNAPPLTINQNFGFQVQNCQNALWFFRGVPNNFFVTLSFEGFDRPMVGPFQHFSLRRSPDDPDVLIGVGSGFTGSPNTTITYSIIVRDAQGVEVGSVDPLIQPLGDPPGG